ncbi:hypothetical protein B7R21_18625 [Subtercola boreus]|uniref:Uncharacterized protein n=1 Tax=Subtercola boreus TaxID=120213 RepID=A0A3E0VA78_9MICO|nr:hypothetical protein [Subtercola boreus]RFA06746.1 hypothetical protein B7R21_18625 [Subtercola boreus]
MVLLRGLRVMERVALLVGMALTVAAVGVSVFFLVRDAVDAARGAARISVPALTQLNIATLGPRVETGAYGDVDLSIVDVPDEARVGSVKNSV